MSFKKVPSAALVALLRERGLSLSCAESCTGGWFAKRVVDTPGASAVFLGGVVCYDTRIKRELLGVSQKTLDKYTVYSTAVAEEMAAGVRKLTGSDLAVSVTGLASPPDMGDIPTGRVCIGVAEKGMTYAMSYDFRGDRQAIRRAAVLKMFEMLLEHIQDTKEKGEH